ncbi:hypothetical protein Herod_00137 [Acinetobacter phage Herod]|nr:hypothetical protein Herod_00137 [Acinetobacter phage Herod]
MTKYKVGDKIKVVATKLQQRDIGITSVNLKGEIGVVKSICSDGVTANFKKGGDWSLRFSDIQKVVE